MNTDLYIKIGKLLHKIKKSGDYIEITANYFPPDYSDWCVSGYCGYEAMRFSNVEESEDGKLLQKLLRQLDEQKEETE